MSGQVCPGCNRFVEVSPCADCLKRCAHCGHLKGNHVRRTGGIFDQPTVICPTSVFAEHDGSPEGGAPEAEQGEPK